MVKGSQHSPETRAKMKVSAASKKHHGLWAAPQYQTVASTPSPFDVGAWVPNNPPFSGSAGAPVGSLLLQTNGVNNASQNIQNLTAGTDITLTDEGGGEILIAAVGATTPATTKTVLWSPGPSTGSPFVSGQDTIEALDSGASTANVSPTASSDYAIEFLGRRYQYGNTQFFGGRSFVFETTAICVLGPSFTVTAMGLVDNNTWTSGFNSLIGPPTGNTVAFVIPQAASTWSVLAGNGVSYTQIDTGISATTGRQKLQINYSPTSANFLIDGTVVETITTNTPLAGSMYMFTFTADWASTPNTLTTEYVFCQAPAA